MSLALFHDVRAGVFETNFDVQNEPIFKRSDLSQYLDIIDIRHNFKNLDLCFSTRADIKIGGGAHPSVRGKKILKVHSPTWIVQYK